MPTVIVSNTRWLIAEQVARAKTFQHRHKRVRQFVALTGRQQLPAALLHDLLEVLRHVRLTRAVYGFESRPLLRSARPRLLYCCLLYTSDAADERSSVDLGG